MNKYASGYTLISLLSALGWLIIAVSIIGGIAIGSNAPPGMGSLGFIIAFAGGFQGLVLLGFGAIGGAILDGSIAQQNIESNLTREKKLVAPQRENGDLMRYLVSTAVGYPGGEFIENYKGNFIIRDPNGNILVGKDSFTSVNAARMKIDASEIDKVVESENMTFDEDGSLLFNGYRIPKKGDKFILNGMDYTSPQKVVERILDEPSSALSRYKV